MLGLELGLGRIYAFQSLYVQKYMCTHICIYVCMYLCMYVCIYTCIYIYIYPPAYLAVDSKKLEDACRGPLKSHLGYMVPYPEP